ncbi:MAG TPA: EAL domain-containing protein [Syntrophales bacterium]|nr:EAL domain-containing protein [Syntrophales bacterium]
MNQTEDKENAKRILVADDDLIIRIVARATLEKAGFIVEEAGDGEQALAAFAQTLPDLILLDVMMPGSDGFTVCREVRSHPKGKHTAILMMTGLDDIESIMMAYEAGATEFVNKPINWHILVHRVHYMLRASQAIYDLQESELRLRSAQRIARLGSWDWDIRTGKVHWSYELYRLLDIDPATTEVNYEMFVNFIHPQDKERVTQTIEAAVAAMQPFSIDHKILLANGRERFANTEAEMVLDGEGGLVRITGTVQDITVRKEDEEKINFLALYDSLTSLPNRMLFRDRLEQALVLSARHNKQLAVMFLDLDHFKNVNDSLGHNVGDELLQQVAQRLQSQIRKSDTIARLGGDEFTLILQDMKTPEILENMAQRIVDSFAEPFLLQGIKTFVSASVGIAIYPSDSETPDDLLRQADAAMYHAKAQGKNQYQIFSAEMQTKANARFSLQNELRRALERDEFVLYYQPKFNTCTGKLTGMEALLRWQHPEKGIIAPGHFLPLAESMELMIPLGEWILMEACRQNVKWQAMGYVLQVAVNLSLVQFKKSDITALVRRVLESTGMDAHLLEIEITERTLMQICSNIIEADSEKIWATPLEAHQRAKDRETPAWPLDEIQKMGVTIALDDFGTCHSSLNYLSNFPVDVLKIDRSFIDLINPRQDNAIVMAIIAMSKKLGIKVVAEGVETEDQRQYLLQQGCHEVQGYLLGRPANALDVAQYFVKISS